MSPLQRYAQWLLRARCRRGLEALVLVGFGVLALLLMTSSSEALAGPVSVVLLFPAFIALYPWLLVLGLMLYLLPWEPPAGVAVFLMYFPIGVLQGSVWVLGGRLVSMNRLGRRRSDALQPASQAI